MEKNFERIVYTYSDNLFRIAVHYLKNSADARDMVQQTFLKLVEKNITFESAEHEKAWLIRVCINMCKDNLKSSWHKKVTPVDEIYTHPSEYIVPSDNNILSHVLKLPPNQKTAIYLFYYEDMPVNEIAQVMNSKPNTVLSWLHRGRKSLEKVLKEEL